jgi:hypothetical protein
MVRPFSPSFPTAKNEVLWLIGEPPHDLTGVGCVIRLARVYGHAVFAALQWAAQMKLVRLVPPLQGWCFWVILKPRAALRSALG